MQLFHVMNLMTALVEIHQYIVEESAVLEQHLVTPLVMEQHAPNVLVCKSCEIECIPLLLLPCLSDNTLSPTIVDHNMIHVHVYTWFGVWCLCWFNYRGLLLRAKFEFTSSSVLWCFGWGALVALYCMCDSSPASWAASVAQLVKSVA